MSKDEEWALRVFETTAAKPLFTIAKIMATFLNVSEDEAAMAMIKTCEKLTAMKEEEATKEHIKE
jgi:hypothetical protein